MLAVGARPPVVCGRGGGHGRKARRVRQAAGLSGRRETRRETGVLRVLVAGGQEGRHRRTNVEAVDRWAAEGGRPGKHVCDKPLAESLPLDRNASLAVVE